MRAWRENGGARREESKVRVPHGDLMVFMKSDESLLEATSRQAFTYFEEHVNLENGLIADSSRPHAPASIAATGMALSLYPIAVQRGWWQRSHAAAVTLATLRFFANSPQNEKPNATGNRGFYTHFLDMKNGARAWKSELSSIDSALLFAGFLTARAYFDLDTPEEREIRERAEELFARAQWTWLCDESGAVSLGWKPKSGFLPHHWRGYNEGLLISILGLGSPTFSLPDENYAQWCSTYKWKRIYGHELLYAGPLFIHQFPQMWLDLRERPDEYMREHQSDYFENSRRATYVQREYARRNPRDWADYSEDNWGISASDGPGPASRNFNGKLRRFHPYNARGVPWGADDGTLAPWAAIASLPFAPEIVLPLMHQMSARHLDFEATHNPTFDDWICPVRLGINQAPMVAMIENYRSGLLWELMRDCDVLQRGLARAGFAPKID